MVDANYRNYFGPDRRRVDRDFYGDDQRSDDKED